MAQRSGLAMEQIERIENNIDIPSLAPLIKIARVLGVRLGTFLDDQDEVGPVVCRKKEAKDAISFSNNAIHSRKHMEYHSLSKSKADRHMEPFIIDVMPTEDTDFVLSSHEGEEFIMVTATYQRIIGHEMVGVVAEVGDTVSSLKIGDRVIINQVTSCGHCYPCSKNRGNVCDNLKVRGVHIDGGYREYNAVPESDCYLLPDSLSDQDAVMIEPTTIAIQSCTRAELEKDDMLLIYGAGALGSSILKIAHTICDHIIVADIMDDKLSEAREHGAQFTINAATEDFQAKVLEYTHGRGATVSIDAACVKNSLLLLLQATGNAGRVITMGFSTAPTEVNQFLITSKELDVRGSRLQNKMFRKSN